MNSKHTPGPWRWSPGCNFVISEHGKVVCENVSATHPRGAPEHTAESLANARVIAEAPAMLALLDRARTRLAEENNGWDILLDDINALFDKVQS